MLCRTEVIENSNICGALWTPGVLNCFAKIKQYFLKFNFMSIM